jgi:hypothetical protein
VDYAFAVVGSGGMAKAVVAALRDAGFHAGTVVARNPGTGAALAERYDYAWRAELGASRPQLLVNATPVGMSGGPAADDLPVAPEVVDAAETVLDVVAVPALTPLVRRPRAQGKQVITGAEVITLQAVEQFVLYTGIRPTDDQVRRATEFSRAQPTTNEDPSTTCWSASLGRPLLRSSPRVRDCHGPGRVGRRLRVARPDPARAPAGPGGGEYGGSAMRLRPGRARLLGGLVGAWQPGQGR